MADASTPQEVGNKNQPLGPEMPTKKDELVTSSSVANEDGTVLEEVWTNAEGINVFDESLIPKLNVRNLQLQRQSIRYKSYSEIAMTPLDMYNPIGMSQENYFTQQESCDGTGILVWLGSEALAWAFDQDVQGIFSKYISQEKMNPREETIICELGCGTGLAGLATLLLTTQNASKGQNVKVIFTDNDMESLENCRDNCELSGIPSDRYCHERLSWGMPDTYPSNCLGAVDVILAADVIYEVKLIATVLQTASDLLRPNSPADSAAMDQTPDGPTPARTGGGYMILSHVPRFCLSREDHDRDDDYKSSDPYHSISSTNHPFQRLEQHIIHLAHSRGFMLVTMFRPHMELQATNDQDNHQSQNHSSRDSSITSSRQIQVLSVHDDVLNQELLAKLQTAKACIFVFQKM